ncbi:MAG: anhydro-N-acetylmuramic acid kinase [Betaproteobacteria bacterium]|nr:anhydro-N-acetylmuramic acid kinase [Betaproteobacteria bacterium]
MRRELYAGVMSGTSLDGIDAAVAMFGGTHAASCSILGSAHVPFPSPLRAELLALQEDSDDEIARAARAGNALADLYADAIVAACKAAEIAPADLAAAGVHGQTLRHRPEQEWTLQLNNPARVAERARTTIVADFRSRDIAAGGQGAPLVPAFHAVFFGSTDRHRAIVNIGGIANITDLPPGHAGLGFDTGPGNVLLDAWCQRHCGQMFDENGAWAASGRVDGTLLVALLAEPFFAIAPPKSTGRGLFNAGWLDAALSRTDWQGRAADVQATLLALTARTVADAIRRFAPGAADVFVCGGGARNATLLQALTSEVAPRRLVTTTDLGIPAEHVEAVAFAWFAREALAQRALDLSDVTGARGPRVLGAVYYK